MSANITAKSLDVISIPVPCMECDENVDVELTGTETYTVPTSCEYCDTVFTATQRAELMQAAEAAWDNYDGPSDADMSDAVSAAERLEMSTRIQRWR